MASWGHPAGGGQTIPGETGFRLKIMELVELRAMHWRSNLAHTQYYVNRPEQRRPPLPPAKDPPLEPDPNPPMPQQFVPQNHLYMPPELGGSVPLVQ